jgi:hypothetical protein
VIALVVNGTGNLYLNVKCSSNEERNVYRFGETLHIHINININGFNSKRRDGKSYNDKEYIKYIGVEERAKEEIENYLLKTILDKYYIFEGTKEEIIEEIEKLKLLKDIM